MKDKNGNNFKFPLRSILVSALVILIFMGVISVYYVMLFTESHEKIIAQGELDAVSSAEKIDKYLLTGIDTIKLVSYTLDGMIRAEKSQEEIHEFLVAQSVAAINLMSSNNCTGLYGVFYGDYIDGTDWVPEPGYDPTTRPWFENAHANVGKVAIVDPYIDAQTNTMMITLSKTLCDFKSVAAMDLSINPLQTATEEITEQGKSDIEIILDGNYNVIAHSDKSEVGKAYLSENDTFGNALVNKLRTTEVSNFSLWYNGKDYIVYAIYTSNDWICLSVSDATSVFSQLVKMLVYTIITSLLLLALMMFVLIRSNRKQAQFTGLSMHVVEAFAAAIDAKDPYTNGHSARVAEYAREISRRFGYNKKKQGEIYMMGLLHDVGKIGTPDAVINKPGKLTEAEYDLIKTHPAMGAYILSKATEMPKMAVGAHWHHERFDGHGYPDGLAGTDIPEEARIIAVADAYDAMTSRRSYRDALPQDVVRREIENGKGTQFDPELADIMLEMIDEDKDYKMRGQ